MCDAMYDKTNDLYHIWSYLKINSSTGKKKKN